MGYDSREAVGRSTRSVDEERARAGCEAEPPIWVASGRNAGQALDGFLLVAIRRGQRRAAIGRFSWTDGFESSRSELPKWSAIPRPSSSRLRSSPYGV